MVAGADERPTGRGGDIGAEDAVPAADRALRARNRGLGIEMGSIWWWKVMPRPGLAEEAIECTQPAGGGCRWLQAGQRDIRPVRGRRR
jgi:hypothetical protein